MANLAGKTIRDLRIAALAGDHAAIRALLRRKGRTAMALKVHRNKPIPPHVWIQVRALTAGTGTATELTRWEERQPDGTIINGLLDPRPRTQRQRALMEE